mmetsp:Transcript_12055/g.24911  ORF Transcript_12055/g.24911 Transcript_12055/m.24911 type:complete len:205 (+) Transcript_12055:465-1079(+)
MANNCKRVCLIPYCSSITIDVTMGCCMEGSMIIAPAFFVIFAVTLLVEFINDACTPSLVDVDEHEWDLQWFVVVLGHNHSRTNGEAMRESGVTPILWNIHGVTCVLHTPHNNGSFFFVQVFLSMTSWHTCKPFVERRGYPPLLGASVQIVECWTMPMIRCTRAVSPKEYLPCQLFSMFPSGTKEFFHVPPTTLFEKLFTFIHWP